MILPLFAFSAAGVDLRVDVLSPATQSILLGVIFGLMIGKPLGIALASWIAIKAKIAIVPDDVALRSFIGAAFLCGIGDSMALLIADQAFAAGPEAAAAKIGALIGSALAAAIGAAILATDKLGRGATPYQREPIGSRS